MGELYKDDPYFVTTQVLGIDDKRIWMYHELYHLERKELVTTNEIMLLAFDLNERKVMRFLPEVYERAQKLAAAHSSLPLPRNASRSIALKAKP